MKNLKIKLLCITAIFTMLLIIGSPKINGSEETFEELASYFIQSVHTEKFLDVRNQSVDYGASISQSEKNSEFVQQWFLIKADSDSYYIKNLHTSKMLAYINGKLVSDGEKNEDAFKWEIIQENQNYKIVNKASGQYLYSGTSEITLENDDGSNRVSWKISRVNPDYPVPEPSPVNTGDYKIGVQTCNLWIGTGHWKNIYSYMERKPVLGWYPEGNPIVTDWEIKMAVDRGISFFVPVWYRTKGNEGKPVIPSYDHWIKSLDDAKYKDYIEYYIMWDNANASMSGIKDKDDFLTNVVPFWIENYFKNPLYMKSGNRPIVSIFSTTDFINSLGGVESSKEALQEANKIAIENGFDGILFIGQFCWGNPYTNHDKLKYIGFEYSMSYHWPTFASGATPDKLVLNDQEVIDGHQYAWDAQATALIPNILTVSMGWDSTPWGGSTSKRKWRLTPQGYTTVMANAKNTMASRAGNEFDSKMLLLDNWNEYGEGHYIMPVEQYGFSYLDSVKEVFDTKTPYSPTPTPKLATPTLIPTVFITPTKNPETSSESQQDSSIESFTESSAEETSESKITESESEDGTVEISEEESSNAIDDASSKNVSDNTKKSKNTAGLLIIIFLLFSGTAALIIIRKIKK